MSRAQTASSYRPPTEADRQLVDGVWRERKHGIEPPKQETDMTKAMLVQARMSPQKVGVDLKMQKAMLLKQMALLDDRCAQLIKFSARKQEIDELPNCWPRPTRICRGLLSRSKANVSLKSR